MSNTDTTSIPEPAPVAMPDLKSYSLTDDISFHKEARDCLDSSISKLIAFKPIFGIIFMYLNKIQDRKIPTMAVGITRQVDLGLYYNPEFVLSLTQYELRAVLIHEALHILLNHISRGYYYGYNSRVANYAADMAINCHISGLPTWALFPEKFGFPNFQSTEWYYEKIKEEAMKNSNGNTDQYLDGKSGQQADDHSKWNDCEKDIIKEKLRNISEKAIKEQHQRGWSKIGTDLAKQIIDANKTIINWKREVRWFINKMISAGRTATRSRINRKEQALKVNRVDRLKDIYVQPGAKKDFKSKLLVAIDTSGSVSDEEISVFLGEVNGMISHVQCDVIFWDTEVCTKPVTISKKIKRMNVAGRGGTDFTPALRFAEQNNYDGIICFSDGYFQIPTRNTSIRVLWGFSQVQDIPSYGKLVHINIDKNKT